LAWQIRFPCCEIAIQNAFSAAVATEEIAMMGEGGREVMWMVLKCGI